MTKDTFNLAAALETLRQTDQTALDKLLFELALAGNAPAVDALIVAGADIETKNDLAWTALHLAAQYGHTSVVEIFLSRRAPSSTPRIARAGRPCT